jgi:hypothetical protein
VAEQYTIQVEPFGHTFTCREGETLEVFAIGVEKERLSLKHSTSSR